MVCTAPSLLLSRKLRFAPMAPWQAVDLIWRVKANAQVNACSGKFDFFVPQRQFVEWRPGSHCEDKNK